MVSTNMRSSRWIAASPFTRLYLQRLAGHSWLCQNARLHNLELLARLAQFPTGHLWQDKKTWRLTNDLIASWNQMSKTSTRLTTLDTRHRAMHLQGQDSLWWQWRQNSRSQSALSRPRSPEQPSAWMAMGRTRPDTSKRTQAIKWKVVFFCILLYLLWEP